MLGSSALPSALAAIVLSYGTPGTAVGPVGSAERAEPAPAMSGKRSDAGDLGDVAARYTAWICAS